MKTTLNAIGAPHPVTMSHTTLTAAAKQSVWQLCINSAVERWEQWTIAFRQREYECKMSDVFKQERDMVHLADPWRVHVFVSHETDT